jgi:sugar transferase (PEP-CTERM/EpsH1 system associated)
MNILYVVPNPPSLVRVRPYNLILHLAKHGHHITVATTCANSHEQDDIERLRRLGPSVIAARLTKPRIAINLVNALVSGEPLQAEYCWQPDLKSQISKIKSQFDVVHVEHLRGARYGTTVQSEIENRKSNIPVVWDSVDCITYLFEQASKQSQSASGKIMTRLELGRTRKHEGRLVRQFDQVLVTSETDRQALERLGHRADIHVLPNGVDLGYFTPADTPREATTLVFSGKMSYHANVTAALYLANQVMPLVWSQRPEVRLVIAGSQPTSSVRQLAKAEPARVEVTGFLPDLRVPLRKASIAIAPLQYGAGIQNKVLEAMACGIPVVASPLAVSALKVQPGKDCLVANSPQTFAEAILRLLSDEPLRVHVGTTGRRYVEAHHNWETIAAQLEAIYERSIEHVRAKNR